MQPLDRFDKVICRLGLLSRWLFSPLLGLWFILGQTVKIEKELGNWLDVTIGFRGRNRSIGWFARLCLDPQLPVVEGLPEGIEEAHVIVAHPTILPPIENVFVELLLAIRTFVVVYHRRWIVNRLRL